jgi:hypothetical protein
MTTAEWRNLLGPPVIAAVIAAAVVGPAIAEPARPVRAVPSVRAYSGAPAAAVAAEACPADRVARPGGWFRLDPLVDQSGSLAGQRLTAGAVGAEPAATLDLDAESFAAGPLDGQIVVGTDDGRRSRIAVIDATSGCIAARFETDGLVRRALLDPDDDAVIEFRLDRRSRADLGIWRRPLSGGNGSLIADPLPDNDRLGRIFSTELAWSTERDRIVVTSCGEAACLVRVIDPGDGSVETIDDAAIGEAIGLSGSTLVAYGGCPALPCDIVGRDLETGRTRILAESAGLATLAISGEGPALVFEDVSNRTGVAVARLDGARIGTTGLDGLRLVPAPHRAGGAIEAPPGFVAVGADGRPSASGVDDRLLRLTDRRLIPAAEAVR